MNRLLNKFMSCGLATLSGLFFVSGVAVLAGGRN